MLSEDMQTSSQQWNVSWSDRLLLQASPIQYSLPYFSSLVSSGWLETHTKQDVEAA